MYNKNAFTLAELIICFSIVGALSLILIPIMSKTSPNADKIMIRKAYNVIEKTISTMINDDEAYADPELGFAATTAVGDKNRFCYYFIDNINTVYENYEGNCTAKTSDGIQFEISNISFPVNEEGNPTNTYNTTITATTKSGTQFYVKVRYDGKIQLPNDSNIIEILENPTDNK